MWVNVGKARVYRWRNMHNDADQHTHDKTKHTREPEWATPKRSCDSGEVDISSVAIAPEIALLYIEL